MKRVLCTVALLMLATAAFAGDLTPQQAMEKMMNCPVCSAWTPDVSMNIRYDIFSTKDGYVESFMNANEAMADQFNKCAAECEKRAATIPTMSAEEKAKLCPFCQARMALMMQKDVSTQNFNAHNGMIMVGMASSPDGQKAAAAYVTAMKTQADLVEQAAMSMGKPETMKSKM